MQDLRMTVANPSPYTKRTTVIALLGVVYGAVLSYLGFLCTGGGHGTFMPLGLGSAPLGLLGVWAALLGTPLLWGLLGFLVARSDQTLYRRIFLVAAIGHSIAAALILALSDSGDWRYIERTRQAIPGIMAAWIVAYAAGQAVMWYGYLKFGAKERNPSADQEPG